MKFIVDEMPYWETDCPFYDCGKKQCKLDGGHCEYMGAKAGERCADECPWLIPQSE